MALFHLSDTIRTLPGGTGQSGATVTFKLEVDDSTITTATTDSDGFFQKSLADTATSGQGAYILWPGPVRYEVTVGAQTRRHSTKSFGVAGPLSLPAQLFLNRAMGTGIVSDPGSGLATWAVTADGADRTVDVATGAAVVEGVAFWNDASRAIDITANASGNPRIDTIVLEVVPQGNATEGKVTLKVVDGTPAGSPVAPTLTQSAVLWQFPLADVAVANGASTISQGNITDRRDYVERATTTVEADMVALEARVDALEVPREEIVAHFSGAFDPILTGAATWNNITQITEGQLTFVNGYTELDDLMFVRAVHRVATEAGLVVMAEILTSVGNHSIRVRLVNPTAGNIDAASGTLHAVVTKLVTS